MGETLTLAELKRQNEEEEAKEQEATAAPEDEAEAESAEVEAVETDDPAEESQEAGEEAGEAEEAEAEAWMQSDDQTSQGEQAVPVAAHAKMRAKLKGKISERDEEIEKLRQEMAALKGGQAQPVETESLPPRPKLEDFGYDQAALDKATDEWYDKRMESKLTRVSQTQAQKDQERQAAQALNQAVDQHYERASKLASESGIDPELYKQSDLTVRQMVENIFPQQGDGITDKIISVLGDGSEKVMYFLGRNASAQNEVSMLLREDPSGLRASAWLGRKQAELTMPKKTRSSAPKPAVTAEGDAVVGSGAEEKKLLKKYRDAHKSGKGQIAYNAKKQAKALGLNVSNW